MTETSGRETMLSMVMTRVNSAAHASRRTWLARP